jgi:hypothetical protein
MLPRQPRARRVERWRVLRPRQGLLCLPTLTASRIGAETAVRRTYHADHRAPPVDRGRRRSDPGARGRPRGRAGASSPAARPRRPLRADVGSPASRPGRVSASSRVANLGQAARQPTEAQDCVNRMPAPKQIVARRGHLIDPTPVDPPATDKRPLGYGAASTSRSRAATAAFNGSRSTVAACQIVASFTTS